MTMDESSAHYSIPIEILQMYESWGLCGAVKKVMGAWQYDEQDIERLSMIMTLHDTGFDREEIKSYMRLWIAGESTDAQGFESFICTIDHTYVEEEYLNAAGKINYHTLKPALFEFPTYEYLRTGEVIAPCLSYAKEKKKEASIIPVGTQCRRM